MSNIESLMQKAAGVSSRLDQILATVDQEKMRIDSLIASTQNQLTTFESSSTERLNKQLTEHADEYGKQLTFFATKHDQLLDQNQEQAGDAIKILQEKVDEASKLVQIVGNIGVTGNYQKIANREKKAADTWRYIALAFMVLMVVVLTAIVALSAWKGFDWKTLLSRTILAALLGIPAGYAARESSRHRANENKNRRYELELASLGPFVEKLPDDVKHRVREQLTSRYFGKENDEPKIDDDTTVTSLVDVLKRLIEKIPKS